MLHDILRGLHILAVIAWMSGLLYLPRLFSYHARAEVGSAIDETFQMMERKLLRIIMNPAMVAVFVLGGVLAWQDGRGVGWRVLSTPWLAIMIAGALALAAWHHYLGLARKAFAAGGRPRSERFWRMTNEIPFVIATIVVLAATTKLGG
ncbi:MAG: CopD family protein [Caulobacteraceae bacterium]